MPKKGFKTARRKMNDQAPTAPMSPCLPPPSIVTPAHKNPIRGFTAILFPLQAIHPSRPCYILNCLLGCRFSLRRATSGCLRCRVPHANNGARPWCSVFLSGARLHPPAAYFCFYSNIACLGCSLVILRANLTAKQLLSIDAACAAGITWGPGFLGA